jgi:hypothetical protein
MVDSVTPGASTAPSELDDDDYDVVNAEQLDGVDDDEETNDEDVDEVASDEEDAVRFQCDASCAVHPRSSSPWETLR